MVDIKYDFKAKGLTLKANIKADGRILLVTGKNGVGKTALLRAVEGAVMLSNATAGKEQNMILSTIDGSGWNAIIRSLVHVNMHFLGMSRNGAETDAVIKLLMKERESDDKIVLMDNMHMFTKVDLNRILEELKSQVWCGKVALALVVTVASEKLSIKEYYKRGSVMP